MFGSSPIAGQIVAAREEGLQLVRGALKSFNGGAIYEGDLAFLGFLERAQALHMGVVDMVERGNPIAAVTLLRSFAENIAVVYYVDARPHEFAKLAPGAKEGLAMGRVIAAAERNLPGFKRAYDHWSTIAHPSGAGAFHTLQVQGDGTSTWQSHPTFKNLDDARQVLKWLRELCAIGRRVVQNAAEARSETPAGSGERGDA